jgi:crotonobetaine/carnitine-CoA ligase
MAASLSELLLVAAGEDPERPFLSFEGRTLSCGEVATAALRAAGWFGREGYTASDRVALMLYNQPEFLVAWLAASFAGVVLVPLDPELRGEELAARLSQTRPRAVIAPRSALPAILALRDRLPSLQLIIAGRAPTGTTPWSALVNGVVGEPITLAAAAPAEIIYTAGATTRARGVIWRRGGLPGAGAAMAQLLGLTARDRLMIVLPLYAFNAHFSVAMALAAGASILLEPGFHAPSFWDAARKGGATQVSLSGLLLRQLLARRPRKGDDDHDVRLVLSNATPKDLHEAFENRFGPSVVEAFGLTEAGFVTANPVERGRRKLGTIGLPLPWCEVAVLDGQGRRLPPGATGELCIRLRPDFATGWGGEYFDDAEAYTRSWQSGWLRSGDLGVGDDEGFLTFIDQDEDVLRRRGETFSTWPIEQALMRHPAVADVAVIALPDGRAGEALALVVLRAPVRFEELAQFCREWLDGHPVPSFFKALERVPKTPTGRVRKAELRKQPGIFDHLHRVV